MSKPMREHKPATLRQALDKMVALVGDVMCEEYNEDAPYPPCGGCKTCKAMQAAHEAIEGDDAAQGGTSNVKE